MVRPAGPAPACQRHVARAVAADSSSRALSLLHPRRALPRDLAVRGRAGRHWDLRRGDRRRRPSRSCFVWLAVVFGGFPRCSSSIDALFARCSSVSRAFGARAPRPRAIRRGRARSGALIVGAGRTGRSLMRELGETAGHSGGRLHRRQPAPAPAAPPRRPRSWRPRRAAARSRGTQTDIVFVTIPDAPRERLDAVVDACTAAGRLRAGSSGGRWTSSRSRPRRFAGRVTRRHRRRPPRAASRCSRSLSSRCAARDRALIGLSVFFWRRPCGRADRLHRRARWGSCRAGSRKPGGLRAAASRIRFGSLYSYLIAPGLVDRLDRDRLLDDQVPGRLGDGGRPSFPILLPGAPGRLADRGGNRRTRDDVQPRRSSSPRIPCSLKSSRTRRSRSSPWSPSARLQATGAVGRSPTIALALVAVEVRKGARVAQVRRGRSRRRASGSSGHEAPADPIGLDRVETKGRRSVCSQSTLFVVVNRIVSPHAIEMGRSSAQNYTGTACGRSGSRRARRSRSASASCR